MPMNCPIIIARFPQSRSASRTRSLHPLRDTIQRLKPGILTGTTMDRGGHARPAFSNTFELADCWVRLRSRSSSSDTAGSRDVTTDLKRSRCLVLNISPPEIRRLCPPSYPRPRPALQHTPKRRHKNFPHTTSHGEYTKGVQPAAQREKTRYGTKPFGRIGCTRRVAAGKFCSTPSHLREAWMLFEYSRGKCEAAQQRSGRMYSGGN